MSGGITLAGTNYTIDLEGSGTIAAERQDHQNGLSGDTLENNGNTISGTGQIGTGNDGTTPLNVNNVSGTIEAIGGTLKISNGTFLTNSGLLEAASTGILDFTIGGIHNNGTNPLASSNASGILVDGTLEIDNPLSSSAAGSLSLGGNGQGVVALAGGTIEGNSSNAETLFNVNNLISGYGHIGLGTDLLKLQNDLHGVIDANFSGQTIFIDTVATINAGTIEATEGGTVAFAGAITNSGALTASDGSHLAFSNETIDNTGTINVDGSVAASSIIIHGTMTLDGGNGSSTGPGEVILTGGSQNAILSDLHAATLVNVDNTISGSGAIGDAYLTVQNDQHGVIDATGILALNAVTTNNSGLLEATSGGTLQIENSVSNSGLIEANGGKVFVDSTATITGTASVTITNGGVAEYAGSSTQTLSLNATFSGSGTLVLDHSQHYGGTVSGFGAGDTIDLTDLTYSSSETDVWNSLTHTLTIIDGTHSSNIIFAGSYGQNSFALTSDANGDTDLVWSPAQASVSPLDSAGNAVGASILTATLTDQHASGVSYQWFDNGVAILSATGSTYLPTVADLGKTLDVVVGYTDHGSAEHVTALAGTVVAPLEADINADGATTNENSPLTLNTLKVSFGDAGSDSITVTLDVIHGTLALDSMVGVSESGAGTVASPFILTGTLSAIDTALANGLVYTPTTGYTGSDTLSFQASDGAFHSDTATADIDVMRVGPVLNSMTLTVAKGGTDVLTNADFSVTDPSSSSFLYTVNNVTGGQFEVFNGQNWVVAQTGGFTTAQIAAGHVEFVQDGTATKPDFSIFVSDGSNVSPAIAPTVNFGDGAKITTANVALAAASFWGSSGEHQGAAVTYADGHVYLSYNNGPETETSSDNATIVGFNTEPSGLSGWTLSYAWSNGDFFGLAADGHEIYAVGESYPAGQSTDDIGGIETKSIFVRFDADGATGSNQPLGTTTHTYYPYSGVESFQGAIATTHGDNTIVYAFGSGQPASYSGYIIGEYNSSGTLLAAAADPGSLPGGSSANGAVDWGGAIWAVGNSQHGSETYASPTVWTFSYDLSSVSIHEDHIGGAGAFNAVTTIGNLLYAAGTATINGAQDYLIAEYNSNGSVAWSETFGAAGASSTLNGIVEVNGRLFVAGSETVGGVTEGVVMEINASNGAVISTTTYEPGHYNAFTSITTDGEHLFVAGVSGSSVTQDQAVLLTYDIGGATVATVEDTAVSVSNIAVSDATAGSAQIEVTLAVGHGSLALQNGSGLASIVGAGTGSVELFGSQAAINAALSHGLVYNPVANYTGSDTLTITANDQGHNATGAALVTTQQVGIAVTPADSIADGATYTVSTATGDTIAFATGHGTLDLVQHASFSGEIAGISGTGDLIEMPGFTASTTTAVTGVGSYDSTTHTTTLEVTDTQGQSQGLTLAGDYSGSSWTVTSDGHGGIYIADPPAPAAATIASGSSLEISTSASAENITFESSTGSLTLDHPTNFTGVISGFTGDGTLSGSDQIDLKGIDYNSHSFTESYNATNDTLSVSDGTNSAVLHFNGSYQAANFSFTTDSNGGTIVYDPPVADNSGAKAQAVTATSHGFVFNFADHGHDAANANHPVADLHVFDGQPFANAQANLNKLQDDSHTNAATPPDSHDALTVASIKAQLHAHDFHFV